MNTKYLNTPVALLILFIPLSACDDGHTSSSIYKSDEDGTKVTQKIIHHIKVHKQLLDLADVRVEYYDDKDIKHTEFIRTESWDSPELVYSVTFGIERSNYGELNLSFIAKPNIDEILENGNYSLFLNDDNANYGADAYAMHEDGVFGGRWTEGGYTYNYARESTNEEIKSYLSMDSPHYRIYMSWRKKKEEWEWFHSSTFRCLEIE